MSSAFAHRCGPYEVPPCVGACRRGYRPSVWFLKLPQGPLPALSRPNPPAGVTTAPHPEPHLRAAASGQFAATPPNGSLAAHVQQERPEIFNKAMAVYAQHPMLVKALGAVAIAKIAQQLTRQ